LDRRRTPSTSTTSTPATSSAASASGTLTPSAEASAKPCRKSWSVPEHAEEVLRGEILLVDVVADSYERNTAAACEQIGISSGFVFIVLTITAVEFSELTVAS